ncbi:MAG: glycerophosphodiester phosphodiesterase [Alphaproteobacteria bacterium]|nr:glycerophosphodiester phosphodiesterase [Alphaproteobacteria bacterium]
MELGFLTAAPIAHRALHDRAIGRTENGLLAVEAAMARGYGIEVDVTASADAVPMVFHDGRLDRLTDERGPLAARPAAALARIRLKGTRETIPTLNDLLALVAGRVPLLVEVKATAAPGPFEAAIADAVRAYKGPLALMSFNPFTMGAFVEAVPQVPRGQVACRHTGYPARFGIGHKVALQHLLYNHVSRPHFVAYEAEEARRPAPQIVRKAGLPLLVWTVRSPGAAALARQHADNIIFEGFEPPGRAA